MAKPDSKAKLGEGGRFAAMKARFAGKKGVYNPAGLAAAIGRKAHGAKQMAMWSRMGKQKG